MLTIRTHPREAPICARNHTPPFRSKIFWFLAAVVKRTIPKSAIAGQCLVQARVR